MFFQLKLHSLLCIIHLSIFPALTSTFTTPLASKFHGKNRHSVGNFNRVVRREQKFSQQQQKSVLESPMNYNCHNLLQRLLLFTRETWGREKSWLLILIFSRFTSLENYVSTKVFSIFVVLFQSIFRQEFQTCELTQQKCNNTNFCNVTFDTFPLGFLGARNDICSQLILQGLTLVIFFSVLSSSSSIAMH